MPKYEEYINSKEWLIRKDNYFQSHPKRCKKCRTKDQIHLHHKSYKNLGSEPDNDLVPLCNSCHQKLHKMVKIRGCGLEKGTEIFLRSTAIRNETKKEKEKFRKDLNNATLISDILKVTKGKTAKYPKRSRIK